MAKRIEPPTKEEMIEFAKLRNLNVDAEYLWGHWTDGDWYNIKGKPVLPRWKQHMWTHHRINESKDKSYTCHICKKSPAPYIKGRDSEGHPYHFCHLHKPQPPPPPKIVKDMAKDIGKIPEEKTTSANEQTRKILGKL